jgi:hypothetical protein
MDLRVEGLPDDPLDAAAHFHAEVLPRVRDAAAGVDHVTLVFAPADHTHRGWRLAVVQGLARDHAPCRINGVASDDESAIAAALAWLRGAEGVTGQYWPLDGQGAGAA